MKIDYPAANDEKALRRLWQEAFGDSDEFLDGFFRSGFDAKHCLCIMDGGRAQSALYWFDGTLNGLKYAYLYAVATAAECQNQGLCRALMEHAHGLLKAEGYAGAILVPGEKGLFAFYEKLGYKTAATVDEVSCTAPAREAVQMQAVSAEEYERLRPAFLPRGGVMQEGNTIRFLAEFARFAKGADFLIAYSMDGTHLICHELLGNADFAGILRTLDCASGRFRTPGKGKPFAMFRPLCNGASTPEYFGLALD